MLPAAKAPRWNSMSPDDRRAFPGDYEAQRGQGPITIHADEHLATTDRGVVMLRRLLAEQIDVVEKGGDPVGVSFDPEVAPVEFLASQNLLDA